MIKNLSAAVLSASVVFGLSAFAAPGGKEVVAEGYLDWTGITPKNYLFGRLITPSDLRQWTVVYVEVDAETFTGATVKNMAPLVNLMPLPQGHVTQWETAELPHNGIVVFSVRNATRDTDSKTFPMVFRPPKDAESSDAQTYALYGMHQVPFYKNLAPVGAPELTADKLPYVAVYGASGTEPLFAQEKFQMSALGKVREAINKAKGLMPKDWTPPLGIREPQFFKTVPALLAKGKPASEALKVLKTGIKSKNSEQAKEAQIMYDALNQYASGLKLRIGLEFHASPARAYYDFQTLIRLFPSEKKKLMAFEQKFKQNKEIGSIGKIFEKMMLWGREDFVPKSAGEAKQIVQELKKYQKALEGLSQSSNAQIQGEAMSFASQIDMLIEVIQTKGSLK